MSNVLTEFSNFEKNCKMPIFQLLFYDTHKQYFPTANNTILEIFFVKLLVFTNDFKSFGASHSIKPNQKLVK